MLKHDGSSGSMLYNAGACGLVNVLYSTAVLCLWFSKCFVFHSCVVMMFNPKQVQ